MAGLMINGIISRDRITARIITKVRISQFGKYQYNVLTSRSIASQSGKWLKRKLILLKISIQVKLVIHRPGTRNFIRGSDWVVRPGLRTVRVPGTDWHSGDTNRPQHPAPHSQESGVSPHHILTTQYTIKYSIPFPACNYLISTRKTLIIFLQLIVTTWGKTIGNTGYKG